MDDLRSLVLDAALAQAVRTVQAVRTAGLDDGQITDTIDVDGAEWHVRVDYAAESDSVSIQGRPLNDQATSLLAAIFSAGGDDGSFSWLLPVQWLTASAATPGEVRP